MKLWLREKWNYDQERNKIMIKKEIKLWSRKKWNYDQERNILIHILAWFFSREKIKIKTFIYIHKFWRIKTCMMY